MPGGAGGRQRHAQHAHRRGRRRLVEEEDEEFVEEYLNKADPSILHFLIASGDDVTSKQLRDDLMTLLIAGHETTAAVLTWTTYLLATHPEIKAACRRRWTRSAAIVTRRSQDMMDLKFTTRVINESMRLYPQPPVLIRRALEPVTLDGYKIDAGTDFFISVWNLHRNPRLWENPDKFDPGPVPDRSEDAERDHGELRVPSVRRRAAEVRRRSVRAVREHHHARDGVPQVRSIHWFPYDRVRVVRRRFLRTFPGVSLRPPLAFNPRPRRLSTSTDAFQRAAGSTSSSTRSFIPTASAG